MRIGSRQHLYLAGNNMNKWLRQNININVVFIIISVIAGGSAVAAVFSSDVQRLNREVFGSEPEKSISVRLGKMEANLNNAVDLLKEIDRKVRP